jgi:hypothetical protein
MKSKPLVSTSRSTKAPAKPDLEDVGSQYGQIYLFERNIQDLLGLGMVCGLAVLGDVVLVRLSGLGDQCNYAMGWYAISATAYLIGSGTGDELMSKISVVLLRRSLRDDGKLLHRQYASSRTHILPGLGVLSLLRVVTEPRHCG